MLWGYSNFEYPCQKRPIDSRRIPPIIRSMRRLLATALILSSLGCSTIQRWTSSDGLSKKERLAKNQEKAIQEANHQAYLRKQQWLSLHQGMTITEVQDTWGLPSSTEFRDGILSYQYRDQDPPALFLFRDGKLTEWMNDRKLIEERSLAAQASQEKQLRERAVQAQERAASAASTAAKAATVGAAASAISTINQSKR